ncbi:isochorismatase family protein [Undibacterium terreum]|uniref:Isochorismatase n=1 Tax=Undibacterium terreum TaxID=1224302 RepID=A0A916UDI4_9BURK|nr:isochorismatase family protein [Undibacterium terreum]GGC68394.1 isochorismatase [Undibacterium terreum]
MSYLCDASRSLLIVIDLQQKLMPVIADGEHVVKRAALLAQAARLLQIPVLGTAQQPLRLGPTVAAIQPLLDKTIEKSSFDACASQDFLAALEGDRDELIITGSEAHVCVLQTALGLLNRKRKVKIVTDAIGSRDNANKAAAIQRAQAAGADIVTSEMVMFEWMRHSEHAQFKQILKLIK